MQKRQTEKIRADESIERLEMARLVQLQPEDAARAQDNAGKKNEVIHKFSNCKSFAIEVLEKPRVMARGVVVYFINSIWRARFTERLSCR